MVRFRQIAAAALVTVLATGAIAGNAAAQEYDKRQLDVVGTWGNLQQWLAGEMPFWTETLPAASGGALTANARPQTELGVSGFEVMRLLRLGTYDVAHALFGYVSSDSPVIEGVDLAGIAQDFETYWAMMDAYRPVLERELESRFGAKLLATYSFSSQQIWCNLGDRSLEGVTLKDLSGKRIRSYSQSLGDIIEGFGGTPVTIAFAEVLPALEKGVADCGITGILSGYSAKWPQVVTHNIRVVVGYSGTFVAMSLRTWNTLNEATQQLILDESAKLEQKLRALAESDDQDGIGCVSTGPCPLGEPAGLQQVMVEDDTAINDVVSDYVLSRWAQRCGAACVDEWNELVGPIAGLTATP